MLHYPNQRVQKSDSDKELPLRRQRALCFTVIIINRRQDGLNFVLKSAEGGKKETLCDQL